MSSSLKQLIQSLYSASRIIINRLNYVKAKQSKLLDSQAKIDEGMHEASPPPFFSSLTKRSRD